MSERPGHDQYYLSLLEGVASRSTCARRKVGAIFVDRRGRAIAMGYNGVPSRWPHCDQFPCAGATDKPGDTTRCMAVHAEVNALLNCTLSPEDVDTVYVSCSPCVACSKMLMNLPNLRRVVCLGPYAEDSTWMLKQTGIETVFAELLGP